MQIVINIYQIKLKSSFKKTFNTRTAEVSMQHRRPTAVISLVALKFNVYCQLRKVSSFKLVKESYLVSKKIDAKKLTVIRFLLFSIKGFMKLMEILSQTNPLSKWT